MFELSKAKVPTVIPFVTFTTTQKTSTCPKKHPFYSYKGSLSHLLLLILLLLKIFTISYIPLRRGTSACPKGDPLRALHSAFYTDLLLSLTFVTVATFPTAQRELRGPIMGNNILQSDWQIGPWCCYLVWPYSHNARYQHECEMRGFRAWLFRAPL
jgi:hypothetical protein